MEFANSGGKAQTVLYSVYDLFKENCIVLYRYRLTGDSVNGSGMPYISSKFGASRSGKINLGRLDGGHIILAHLDVFKNDPEDIRRLLDFCELGGKSLYLPVSDGIFRHSYNWRGAVGQPVPADGEENAHRYRIREIIKSEYEHVCYDFRSTNTASKFGSMLAETRRDLAFRAILG